MGKSNQGLMAVGSDSAVSKMTVIDFAQVVSGASRENAASFLERFCRDAQVLAERLESALRLVVEGVELLETAGEVCGYEPLLQIEFDHHYLVARIYSCFITGLGRSFEEENADSRHVTSLVREIGVSATTVKISNWARKLKLTQCASLFERRGLTVYHDAIPAKSADERAQLLGELVESACSRDQSACSRLHLLCAALVSHLPEPRGRKMLRETGNHAVLLVFMHDLGKSVNYTYREDRGYVDSATMATVRNCGNGAFSPLTAIELKKEILRTRAQPEERLG